MNKRVICRQLGDVAIERVVVGEAKRVFYIDWPANVGAISTDVGPIGFPKDCVFEYVDGVAGKKLSQEEWAKLKPLRKLRNESGQGTIRRSSAADASEPATENCGDKVA